ncbi:putative HAD hydrolase, subfamily IA, HAD superfamily [Helianthus anomalus]
MVKKLDIEESKVLEMCIQLYKDYGTTMAGLRLLAMILTMMTTIGTEFSCNFFIFSNANEAHVAEVLGRLGLGGCFDDVICFESLNLKTQTANASKSDNEPLGLLPKSPIVCKPSENAFQQAFKMANINHHKTLFFDDSIHNIQTAKLTGLTTVWVGLSQRRNGVDYALESIHNIREIVPELWESVNKSKDVQHSENIAIEMSWVTYNTL